MEEIDPNGNRFVYEYDEDGKLFRASDPEGGNWTFSRSVDTAGSVRTNVVSAEGEHNAHDYRVGPSGERIATATDASGAVSSTTTSADDTRTSISLSCGTATNVSYTIDKDFQVRLLKSSSSILPSGKSNFVTATRSYRYDDQGPLPAFVDESMTVNGKNWQSTRGIRESDVVIISPMGKIFTITYDPVTLLTKQVSRLGVFPASFEYDARGRLTSTTTGNRTLHLAYDTNGNLDYLVTPDNKTYDYTYDIMGRLRPEVRPDQSEVEYQYDANGNLAVLVNPNQVGYGFDYTANNQRLTMGHPLSGFYQYHYDRDRRLKDIVLPSGRTISNVYNAGVLDYTVTPEGIINYDYACSSRMSSATRGGEGLSFTYDGPLVTSEGRTGTLTKSIGYTYNNDFALASMTYAGTTVSFGYDNDGLLTSADGYTITRNAQNGLPQSLSGVGFSLSRTFSGYGELDATAASINNSQPYSWSVTARDNAGRITQRTEVIGGETISWEYGYDAVGRLLEVKKNSAVVESYTYDPNGNRLTEMNGLRGITERTYQHTIEDHVVTAGFDSYTFAVDGFLQQRTAPDGDTLYQYSSRGELLRVDKPDGTILTYVHDPFGRRIAKQMNGVTVEKYLWAGQTTLLAVYDDADNVKARFTYADARTPVSMSASGTTFFLLTDQVGTLRAVADTSGAIVKRIDYDSFGNIISDSNPSFSVPFGFAGGLHDHDTGLVRFGYRDYSPELGRFTAKDPIDFAGGDTNLYAYVSNDPIRLSDPEGLMAPVVGAVVLVGAVGAIGAFAVCMDRCMGLPGRCPPNDGSSEWNSKFSRCARLCVTPTVLWETISDPFASTAKTIGEKIGGHGYEH